jgi:exopolyphosphatase
LKRFATERELDLYSMMTTSTSSEGHFQRELLVWAFNESAISAAKRFANDSRDELGLEDWRDNALGQTEDGTWRRVWWQRHVQHSRKRVAPLLREALA